MRFVSLTLLSSEAMRGVYAQMVSHVNCTKSDMIPNQLRLARCFSRISPPTLALQMYSARSKEVRSYAKGNRICGSLRESPGTLAQVAKVLGDAKVNILSSSLQHPRPRAPCRLCFRQNWVRLVKTILAHSLCPCSFQNRTCLKGFLIGDRPKRARASCLQDPNLSLGAGLRQRGTQLVKMF